jgi:hypothetical protein
MAEFLSPFRAVDLIKLKGHVFAIVKPDIDGSAKSERFYLNEIRVSEARSLGLRDVFVLPLDAALAAGSLNLAAHASTNFEVLMCGTATVIFGISCIAQTIKTIGETCAPQVQSAFVSPAGQDLIEVKNVIRARDEVVDVELGDGNSLVRLIHSGFCESLFK